LSGIEGEGLVESTLKQAVDIAQSHPSARPDRVSLQTYVQIARPDHWIKNIFVIPGFAAALAVAPHSPGLHALPLVLALISACLTASANYTLNEFLDAQSDSYHPLKGERPGARGLLDSRLVFLQYLFLASAGLLVAALISGAFYATDAALVVMGVLYNASPVRTKDKAYLDVLSESINNPIRFLLGWFAVTSNFLPPASVLLAYWMGGAFFIITMSFHATLTKGTVFEKLIAWSRV
jgi:decaprenyl-phosphate phosphoribosyltransferase